MITQNDKSQERQPTHQNNSQVQNDQIDSPRGLFDNDKIWLAEMITTCENKFKMKNRTLRIFHLKDVFFCVVVGGWVIT